MEDYENSDIYTDDGLPDETDDNEFLEESGEETGSSVDEEATEDNEQDTSNVDEEVSDRLGTLIDTITNTNKQEYYNSDLGFYVFPDLDTLLLYYPPEDNDLTEWIQTSDDNWVRLENLETYESFIFEQSENMEMTASEESASAEMMERMDGNLALLASSVSENSITITTDPGTTALLQDIIVNQNNIHTEIVVIGGVVSVIFLVVVVDYIQRCAKRIIKNFMGGSGNNND